VSGIRFAKYSGAGNDFIMIDNRDAAFPATRELIAQMCARRISVGADGLILVEPSEKAAVRMRYYNSDGGEAEMCGNGARCFVAFARELGLTADPLTFEIMERVLSGWAGGERVTIEMGEIRYTCLDIALNLDGESVRADFTNTGVPHAVVLVEDVEALNIEALGSAVRHHQAFQPAGANADFVQIGRDGGLVVRTYERGVEGETLACGTGVVASAVVAHLVKQIAPPVHVRVRSGDVLTVGFQVEDGNFSQVTLNGPAVRIYDGVYHAHDAS